MIRVQPLHHVHDAGTVGAPVGEIPEKDKPPSLGVFSISRIAEFPKQGSKCVNLAVNVADDVDRAAKQGLNKRGHGEFQIATA